MSVDRQGGVAGGRDAAATIGDRRETAEQYADSSRLNARARLHIRYSRVDWFAFVAARLDLREGARVLDVGCGPGWFWGHGAHGSRPDVALTLLDRSPAMVEEAVEKVRALARYGAVEGLVADVTELDPADLPAAPDGRRGPADAVVAMHVLYHVADQAVALDAMARCLRPGGGVLVTTNDPRNMAEIGAISARVFGGDARDPGGVAFSPERGAALMRERFADLEMHETIDVLRCTQERDVRDFVTSFPPGDRATPDQLRSLDAAISDAFTGGVLEISKRSVVLTARRPGAPAR